MGNKSLAIIAAISVIGLLFLVYLAATFESPQGTAITELETPVPRAPAPVERAPAPVSSPVAEAPGPAETTAEEEAPVVEPAPEPIVELPSLNESDEFLLPRLAALETGERLMDIVASDDLIRKFVVFTDNAAQGNLPQLEYPVQRITEDMDVKAVDDKLFVMEPSSHDRFDDVIDSFVAIDVRQGVQLFDMTKPLLQNAYAEIGYPNRDFEETMIAAIDTVLNAREVEGPFELVKPSVMYLYAEQEIEDMTPIEKQLIRIGPENTAKLKEKLREYKAYLEARPSR